MTTVALEEAYSRHAILRCSAKFLDATLRDRVSGELAGGTASAMELEPSSHLAKASTE